MGQRYKKDSTPPNIFSKKKGAGGLKPTGGSSVREKHKKTHLL
jgi:hypothetical protein